MLNLGLDAYDGWVGIVVYPGDFVIPRQVMDEDGVVHEYDEVLSGEALEGGPVMLSWRDVRASGASAASGYSVVVHEFAHVLDMADGVADGVPLLPAGLPRRDWLAIVEAEYEAFCARLERGEPTSLDPYGGHAPEEFLAVASESFFVDPQAMRAEHPRLYALFQRRFYGQDPAARPQAPAG